MYLLTNQKLVLPEQRAKEGEEEDEGQQWCIQVHGQGLVTDQRSVLSLSTNQRSVLSLTTNERSVLSLTTNES